MVDYRKSVLLLNTRPQKATLQNEASVLLWDCVCVYRWNKEENKCVDNGDFWMVMWLSLWLVSWMSCGVLNGVGACVCVYGTSIWERLRPLTLWWCIFVVYRGVVCVCVSVCLKICSGRISRDTGCSITTKNTQICVCVCVCVCGCACDVYIVTLCNCKKD